MSVARRIFYNTFLQSVGKIVSVSVGLVSVGLMTRYLGDAGYGEYTTIVSFMGFFGIVADLGLYLVTTSEISKEGADQSRVLGNVFGLRFFSVIIALTVGAFISLLFPYGHDVKVGMFLGIAAFTFVSATQILVGVFQKHLVFYQMTASEIVQRLVTLIGTLFVIQRHLSVLAFVAVLIVANAAHFFLSFYLAQKLIPFRLNFDTAHWKEILRKSWPLGFSVILNLIYFRADTLILSVFKSASDVGVYGLP